MSFTPDVLRLVIEGRDFTRWAGYRLSTNVFTPPATFRFTMGRVDSDTLGVLQPGARVEIYVDVEGVDHLYLTGRIGAREHAYSVGSHTVQISGHDLAQELMVSTCPLDTEVKDQVFGDVVESLIEPWGIPLAYSNELARAIASNKKQYKSLLGGMTKVEYLARIKALQKQHVTAPSLEAACRAEGIPVPSHVHHGIVKKVKDAKVKPGESVWQFIERMSNKAELKMWVSPDGDLVISRPKYNQDATYVLSHRPSVPRENNVLRADEKLDIDGIPTSLTAHGEVKPKGGKRQPYASQQMSTVLSTARDNYDLHRPMFAKETDARTKDDFQKRAFYAMKDAEKNYRTLTYLVSRHSQAGVVWTPDTTVRVIDETLGVDGLYYVAGVTFARGRVRGAAQPQTTELQLTPLDCWVPSA